MICYNLQLNYYFRVATAALYIFFRALVEKKAYTMHSKVASLI